MKPPIDFLLVCSNSSLKDFELNRLNFAANLRKDALAIEDQIRQAEAEATFARWLSDYREDLITAGAARQFQASLQFPALAAGPARVIRKKMKEHLA